MARSTPRQQEIEAVRRFNRFYTHQIGVLQEHLLHSPFSLTDVRVLYEIAHRARPTATELAQALDLDGGYLSRILQRFTRLKLIARSPSTLDARQTHLALTAHGRATFEPLQKVANEEIGTMLKRLASDDRARLLSAMATIESCLDPTDAGAPKTAASKAASSKAAMTKAATSKTVTSKTATSTATSSAAAPFTLRTHRPGDLGWIVHRHATLYAQEYGWNADFEAIVADIAARFLREHDETRERCWIAERDEVNIGSVMLVEQSARVAKLRLLLVEPAARGLGLGKRLVHECIQFARGAGYRTITLWTQANLSAARGIYKAAGFELISQTPQPAFGHDDLVSETWELKLV